MGISNTTTHLIPPQLGEIFAGGYHIERNPITGGHRLEQPEEECSKRKKQRPQLTRRHTTSCLMKQLKSGVTEKKNPNTLSKTFVNIASLNNKLDEMKIC